MRRHETDAAAASAFALKWALRNSGGEIANLARAYLRLEREAQPRWIPCEEMMPGDDEGYVATLLPDLEEHSLRMWRWDPDDGLWHDEWGDTVPRETFSSWQPIPAPPEETKP